MNPSVSGSKTKSRGNLYICSAKKIVGKMSFPQLPLFPLIIGDGHQPNRGLYTHYKDSLFL